MPTAGANETLARQWEILRMLPGKPPGRTAADITAALDGRGFKASKRTVERDLNNLALTFPLVSTQGDKAQGWHFMEGRSLDLPGIDLADALSLRLLERSLKPLLPASILATLQPRFHAAATKIAELSGDNAAARWADKVETVIPALSFVAPEIDKGVLEVLQEALFKDLQFEAVYRAVSTAKESRLRFHPLGLVQRGGVLYLVASANDYREPRVFAVHRLHDIRITAEPVRRPKGFRLADYIDEGGLQFGSGEKITLILRVKKPLWRVLVETRLSRDQRIEGDGEWVKVSATVRDTWQLRWWLLAQSGMVLVIEPETLRKDIQGSLKEALKLYAKGRGSSR